MGSSPPPSDGPPPADRRYKAFRDAVDGSYNLGFDHGWEARGEHLEDELRDQLQHEVERFDPDCPLCLARRRIRDLETRVASLEGRVTDLDNRRRDQAIRSGERPYFETRPPD